MAERTGTPAGPVAVTADVVVLTIREGALSALLVCRADQPYRGRWALPGGVVDPTEDLEGAARRVLDQETGLGSAIGHLEQLATFGAPGRDPRARVVSVAHLGLVPDLPTPVGGERTTSARFWPVATLEGTDGPMLAFDHDQILAAGIERAQAKLEYVPLATTFVAEAFTLAQLRQVYEAVWRRPVHPANFRRKVLSIEGFVVPLGRTTAPAEGRPADLYRAGPARLLHPALLRPRRDPTAPARDAEADEL